MTAGMTRKSLQKIHDDLEYYPHQLVGIRTMATMSSFLLADEMGLGKSLQALTVAAIDFERDWAKRVIVVAPATLKWNWEQEITDHTSFTALVLNGTPKERRDQLTRFVVEELDILIVNYEQVTSHLEALNKLNFDIAIYDEAHYLKNYKSKRTKASLKLNAQRHFLLTGSPMLNQVNELWPLLHRINPTKYPKYWSFLNRYAVYGGYQNKQIVGVKNRGELMSELHDVMIRRLKKDVLDLPEKQHIKVYVDLSPKQRELYTSAMDDLSIELPDSPTPMELENALTKYLRLKQICGTTACIEGYDDESTKLDRMTEMVTEIIHAEESPGEPVVVWTQFRMVQQCARERLEKKGITVFEINGDTPKETRAEIVKVWASFRDEHDRPAVLISMLQVGGVGLNMTAASKCIFIDKLYVPKLNEQAEDRIHRIGADKTKPIQIYEIIARKTIEQRIEAILRRKTKLFGSIVEESDWKQALAEALLTEEDGDE